ncbi:MAG: hypothetical protein HYY78_09440 [Betaproteobacteria bacterium]|nr:hypothetical protein [Betaproteobacteria bacterium]
MVYKITAEPGLLRAELFDRETGEEMQAFLRAIARENAKHRRARILILVRSSKPIFQVVPHRLIDCLEELSGTSPHPIALVGDTRDLHMSHEYIELIARQRGLNVRSFQDEAAALRWFKERRELQDRRLRRERRLRRARRLRQEQRLHQERRLQQERRAQNGRRQRQRRASAEAPRPGL